MGQQLISTGIGPNTGTGDPGFTSWTKANSNFTELYLALSGGTPFSSLTVGPPTTGVPALTVNNQPGFDGIDINVTQTGYGLNIIGAVPNDFPGVAVQNATSGATAGTLGLIVGNDGIRSFIIGKTSTAFVGSKFPGSPAGEISYIQSAGNVPISFVMGTGAEAQILGLAPTQVTVGGTPITGGVTTQISNTSALSGDIARVQVTADTTSGSFFAAPAAQAVAIVAGGPTGAQTVLRNLGNYPLVFGTSNTYRGQIDSTGQWIVATPTSGVALTAKAFAGNFAFLATGPTATASPGTIKCVEGFTGDFGGMNISNPAGNRMLEIIHCGSTSAGAYGAPANGNIINSSGTAASLTIATGDLARMTFSNTGNVAILAPTSGTAFSVTGFPGASAVGLVTQANGFAMTCSDGTNLSAGIAFGGAHQGQFGSFGGFGTQIISGNRVAMDIAVSGAVAVLAPTSGLTLQVNGTVGANIVAFSDGVNSINFKTDVISAINVNNSLSLNIAGTPALSISSTRNVAIAGNFGCNGAVSTQDPGWGTPTGTVLTTNFPGSTATLLQTAQSLARIILILRNYGFIGV